VKIETSGQADSMHCFTFSRYDLYLSSSWLVHQLWDLHFWLSFNYQCSIITVLNSIVPYIFIKHLQKYHSIPHSHYLKSIQNKHL